MKKIIALLLFVAVLAGTACSNNTPEPKKEVIVVPAKTPVVVEKTEPAKTTVDLNKNGVQVSTKKVAVKIN